MSFPYKTITEIVLGVSLVIVVGWDIVADIASVNGTSPGATISEILFKLAKTTPMIPLAVGVVMGHLFMDLDMWPDVYGFTKPRPIIALVWGIISGAMFWYQGGK